MMQLPRGTFREIRKNTTVEKVLKELEQTKFSGICSLSLDRETGTLVYHSGTCILVKFHEKSGDPGWDELQKYAGEVDAALSTLDEAQVQLSLEFNKACRLVKAGRSGPPRKTHAPYQAVPPAPVRVLHKSAPVSPSSTGKVLPEKNLRPAGSRNSRFLSRQGPVHRELISHLWSLLPPG